MKKEDYILGYLFKGKFFLKEEDMRGMTMTEDNKPVTVYNPAYVEAICMVNKKHMDDKLAIIQLLMKTES